MVIVQIPIERIHIQVDEHGEPINPRGPVTDTTDLQKSIATSPVGLLEPLVVRWKEGAKETAYWLVHGHRRLTAVTALGWKTVPCHVLRSQGSPEEDILHMLAGDTGQPYPPFYLAKALARLRDAGKQMKEIADAWGKTPDMVSAHIQLLDAAPVAQKAVMEGKMGMSVFALVKHLPPTEQAQIINGADGAISMRYVKERMRQRKEATDPVDGRHRPEPSSATNHPQNAPPGVVDRTVKWEYHRALAAVRSVQQATRDGRLPASFGEWPADVQVLHDELVAALELIQPFGEKTPDAPKKPAPSFL